MRKIYRLKLKGLVVRKLGDNKKSQNRIAQDAIVSAPTVARYVTMDKAWDLEVLDLAKFPTVVIQGMDVAPELLMSMRLSDLFDLVETEAL